MNLIDILFEQLSHHINYLAVVAAALANFAFGAIWYSPLVVAKKWAAIVFKDRAFGEIGKEVNMGMIFGITFVLGVVQSLGLALLLANNEPSFFYGAAAGASVATLFVVMNTWKNSLYEQRPFRYVLINGVHDVVVFMLMGGIVGVWK